MYLSEYQIITKIYLTEGDNQFKITIIQLKI